MFNFEYILNEIIKEKIEHHNIIQKCLTLLTFQKKT